VLVQSRPITTDNNSSSLYTGYGLSNFSDSEMDIICGDVKNQNTKLRQEIENQFPEIRADPRKSDEQVEATYTEMYEGISNCLHERKLVR